MFSGIRSFQEESWQPCLAHAVRLMVVLNTIPAAEMLTLGKKLTRRTLCMTWTQPIVDRIKDGHDGS